MGVGTSVQVRFSPLLEGEHMGGVPGIARGHEILVQLAQVTSDQLIGEGGRRIQLFVAGL